MTLNQGFLYSQGYCGCNVVAPLFIDLSSCYAGCNRAAFLHDTSL